MNDTATVPARKLSAKTIWGKVKKSDIPTGKEVKPLFRIIGQAMGIRSGEGEYGKWVALVGTFEAMNLETGEVFVGPEAFLPEPYNGMIAQKFMGEKPVNAVDFAFEVGIKASPDDDPTRVPYEYTCKPLQDATEGDPLQHLRTRLKALPPPPADDKSGAGKGRGK